LASKVRERIASAMGGRFPWTDTVTQAITPAKSLVDCIPGGNSAALASAREFAPESSMVHADSEGWTSGKGRLDQ